MHNIVIINFKEYYIRPYRINCLFDLTWPQKLIVGLVGRAGDNLTKNFNYKCLVFLCKLVVYIFQLSRGVYYVVA